MLTVLLNVFKCKEITACVVKYTVKDNFDSFFMTCCYEVLKIFICSKTGIQFLVISGFITMSYTLE